MNKFKTIKDRGRERRLAELSAVTSYKAYKPTPAERINRQLHNRRDPARLTRVLAVFGD